MLPQYVLDFLNGTHGPVGMLVAVAVVYLLNRYGVTLPYQFPTAKPADPQPLAPAESPQLLLGPAAGLTLAAALAKLLPVILPAVLPYLLPYLSRLLTPAPADPANPPPAKP